VLAHPPRTAVVRGCPLPLRKGPPERKRWSAGTKQIEYDSVVYQKPHQIFTLTTNGLSQELGEFSRAESGGQEHFYHAVESSLHGIQDRIQFDPNDRLKRLPAFQPCLNVEQLAIAHQRSEPFYFFNPSFIHR
jgi:hypothetical protein